IADPAAAGTARTSAASDGAPRRTSCESPIEESKSRRPVTAGKYPGRSAPATSPRQSATRGGRVSQTVPPHIGQGGSARWTTAPYPQSLQRNSPEICVPVTTNSTSAPNTGGKTAGVRRETPPSAVGPEASSVTSTGIGDPF